MESGLWIQTMASNGLRHVVGKMGQNTFKPEQKVEQLPEKGG
jgi:hypothetical protein